MSGASGAGDGAAAGVPTTSVTSQDPAGRELAADEAGSAAPRRRKPRDTPLLIVITGTGKGKSTSAFGMLLRSWSRGYRCGVFQFVKSGKWKVGEAKAAEALGGIDWEKMGDGWSWLSRDLAESADLAREGWAHVKAMIAAERYEFLLLDEMTYPIKWGWIDVHDVVETLANRPGFQHVVITGRDAAPELIAAADLVTEVTKVKHPMDAGIRAQQGIEW
jgi:cob(I)alamin adenosyltransferase